MSTIREIIDTLNEKDRRILLYSFEHGMSKVIKYADSKFIAVNFQGNKSHRITTETGKWSIGNIEK